MKALWYLSLALLSLFSRAALAEGAGIRRFAVVAGANNGGASRVTLRYATSDAQSVAKVLQELGGVSKDDLILLSEPDLASFKAAFASMKTMIASAKAQSGRTELFVYYSGHSDEDGLLLNGSLFTYSDLRASINGAGADVGVAILDSCASGAMTLQKGGEKKPPFLRDLSAEVKGHAFLTSSSADEVAQESERIGASFFTYFLVSGLRGAADSTGDGKVTLHEAYQFAFSETLARTENSQGGPQHPAYDIQLTGTGDLVMTDLRETSASLSFDSALSGRLYIRDDNDHLLCELHKDSGRLESLALSPGKYRVGLEADGKLFQANVELSQGSKGSLTQANFTEVSKENTRARGDGPQDPTVDSMFPLDTTATAQATPEEEAGEALAPTPAKSAKYPPHLTWHDSPTMSKLLGKNTSSFLRLGYTNAQGVFHGASFGLVLSYASGDLQGMQVVPGFAMARGDAYGMQVAGGGNLVHGNMVGLQASAGANMVAGNLGGLQATGGLNVVTGSAAGLQAAALMNWTNDNFWGIQAAPSNIVGGNFQGLQASAGLGIIGGDLLGMQAGVANILNGSMVGMQAGVGNIINGNSLGMQAGVANILNGQLHGFQAGVGNLLNGDSVGMQAGVGNILHGHLTGFQVGVGNLSTDGLYGAQVGVLNIGGNVLGAQIGLLNIAKSVQGTQIGLVNLSGHVDGVPIGLFSYSKSGLHRIEVWANDLAPLNAGLKIGSDHFYTLFDCGIIPSINVNYICGMGLGVHEGSGVLQYNVDVTSSSSLLANSSLPSLMNSARFLVELHSGKNSPLSIVAGPTINTFINFNGKPPAQRDLLPEYLVFRGNSTSVVLSPGFVLGMSL